MNVTPFKEKRETKKLRLQRAPQSSGKPFSELYLLAGWCLGRDSGRSGERVRPGSARGPAIRTPESRATPPEEKLHGDKGKGAGALLAPGAGGRGKGLMAVERFFVSQDFFLFVCLLFG